MPNYIPVNLEHIKECYNRTIFDKTDRMNDFFETKVYDSFKR